MLEDTELGVPGSSESGERAAGPTGLTLLPGPPADQDGAPAGTAPLRRDAEQAGLPGRLPGPDPCQVRPEHRLDEGDGRLLPGVALGRDGGARRAGLGRALRKDRASP